MIAMESRLAVYATGFFLSLFSEKNRRDPNTKAIRPDHAITLQGPGGRRYHPDLGTFANDQQLLTCPEVFEFARVVLLDWHPEPSAS